jgi:hypothetical protein
VFVPDIVAHAGRFCEVATRNGRFFGELVRLSTAVFLVRSKWPSGSRSPIIEASDITKITDLADPHL